jgi:hypothetical protein
MSQKRVSPVPSTPPNPSTNRPVFSVAPPNKADIVSSVAMVAESVGAFYTGLVNSGVPEDTAKELTMAFVAGLPEMFKAAN